MARKDLLAVTARKVLKVEQVPQVHRALPVFKARLARLDLVVLLVLKADLVVKVNEDHGDRRHFLMPALKLLLNQ